MYDDLYTTLKELEADLLQKLQIETAQNGDEEKIKELQRQIEEIERQTERIKKLRSYKRV